MCIMSIHCHHYYLPSHWLWPNKLTARTEEKTVSCPYRIDWRGKRQAVNSWRCNLTAHLARPPLASIVLFLGHSDVNMWKLLLFDYYHGLLGRGWIRSGHPQRTRLPAFQHLKPSVSPSVFTSESSKDSTSSSSPLGLWWCSVYETLLLSPPIRPNFGHALEPPP